MTLETPVKLIQVEKWDLGRKKGWGGGETSVGIGVKSKARKLRGPAFCCIVLNMSQPSNKRLFNKTLSILYY